MLVNCYIIKFHEHLRSSYLRTNITFTDPKVPFDGVTIVREICTDWFANLVFLSSELAVESTFAGISLTDPPNCLVSLTRLDKLKIITYE